MLHQRNSDIAFFVEHPVYSNFKVEIRESCSSILICRFLLLIPFVQAIYIRRTVEEVLRSFFCTAPCIQHFQTVKSPHSGLFSIFQHLRTFRKEE